MEKEEESMKKIKPVPIEIRIQSRGCAMSKTINHLRWDLCCGGTESLPGSEDAYVYLVDAKSCLVLIDAGVGYGNDKIREDISSLGSEPAQVWILLPPTATSIISEDFTSGGISSAARSIAHELDRAGLEGKNNELTAASMYGVDTGRSCLIPSSLASIIRSVWRDGI